MNPFPPPDVVAALRAAPARLPLARWPRWALSGLLMAGALAWWLGVRSHEPRARGDSGPARDAAAAAAPAVQGPLQGAVVRLNEDQQRAVGLRTVQVRSGTAYDVLSAPGRIAADELQYAHITPRAPGVVRSVSAHVGQDVREGDLLATVDSPVVGEARVDLHTRLQTLEITQAQADWQGAVHRNTLELIGLLREGTDPDEIHRRFADRAVGENRERLMTAYARYRLAVATIGRDRALYAQSLITAGQSQAATAGYQVAQATYQGLMDQMGHEAKLADTRARQAMQQAEAAARAARERLRILGVGTDGIEPEGAGALVSTYAIRAPFDGTVLDREMIVPGVAVDMTHRIFTMANLSTVWVEANVHESHFAMLARSRNGKVRFRSPAYPGRSFDAEILYTGDLVEDRSLTVKLLARARNPERLLKPGMFLEVEVLSPGSERVAHIPASALLTQGGRTSVYVRTGPERFERREVVAGVAHEGDVEVRRGLEPGEEVVVEGGFPLKALAVELAGAMNGGQTPTRKDACRCRPGPQHRNIKSHLDPRLRPDARGGPSPG